MAIVITDHTKNVYFIIEMHWTCDVCKSTLVNDHINMKLLVIIKSSMQIYHQCSAMLVNNHLRNL